MKLKKQYLLLTRGTGPKGTNQIFTFKKKKSRDECLKILTKKGIECATGTL